MEKLIQIPDEIIEQLITGRCKICGKTNVDIFGVLYPDCEAEWGGYSVILYPMHFNCLSKTTIEEVKDILQGELILNQACGEDSPFLGLREVKK